MSIDYGILCSIILKHCFSETVQAVGDSLFAASSRTLHTIVQATQLPKKKVTEALNIMVKYRLVLLKLSEENQTIVHYALNRDTIIYILRYSRYVSLIANKFGRVAAEIVSELLYTGAATATNTLLRCLSKSYNRHRAALFRDAFRMMVGENYLMRLPRVLKLSKRGTVEIVIPRMETDPQDLFTPPEIDLRLILLMLRGTAPPRMAKDTDIIFHVNFERFHQDFRDTLMINEVENRLGVAPRDCFIYVLRSMYERTNPWQRPSSNPFTFDDLKTSMERSGQSNLIKSLNLNLSMLESNLRFIRKLGNYNGGQYVVDMESAFEEMVRVNVRNVINERYGSKASCIFRIVCGNNFIEKDELRKEAMLSDKEALFLSYKLYSSQFLNVANISKCIRGQEGLKKVFYFLHLQQKQIVQMMLDNCYKVLYHNLTCPNGGALEDDDSTKLTPDIVEVPIEDYGEDEYISEILEMLTPPEQKILDAAKKQMQLLADIKLTMDDSVFLYELNLYYCTHAD